MPTLSTFYGIDIRMFWSDHSPPHFHVLYSGEAAVLDIRHLRIIRGALTRRALRLTLLRARQHRSELLEAWHQCENNQTPQKIAPLE